MSPGCAMGFACGREVAGGGERQGRRRPSSFRLSRSAADPVAAGPDVRARVHVRVAGEAEGREGTLWAGRRAGTGGVEGGRESRSHSRPLRVGGSSQSARAPCVGPRPQYQPVQRERGRRVAARARWNVYGCRGSRAPSRVGKSVRSVAESAVELVGVGDGWGDAGWTNCEPYAGASEGVGVESVRDARATGVVDAS